jgi:hypothetical protein
MSPKSDASKTGRRSRKTERHPDDGEGVALDCPSVTFGVRGTLSKQGGALSKQEGASTKRNVAFSIQYVAFVNARATFSILDGASWNPGVSFTKPSDALPIHRSRPSIPRVSFSFIGRDHRFQVSPFRRKRAARYPGRHARDSQASDGHETARPPMMNEPSERFLSTAPFIAPRFSLATAPESRRGPHSRTCSAHARV